LKYPRHLLELGGLLEVLDGFEYDNHYPLDDSDYSDSEDNEI